MEWKRRQQEEQNTDPIEKELETLKLPIKTNAEKYSTIYQLAKEEKYFTAFCVGTKLRSAFARRKFHVGIFHFAIHYGFVVAEEGNFWEQFLAICQKYSLPYERNQVNVGLIGKNHTHKRLSPNNLAIALFMLVFKPDDEIKHVYNFSDIRFVGMPLIVCAAFEIFHYEEGCPRLYTDPWHVALLKMDNCLSARSVSFNESAANLFSGHFRHGSWHDILEVVPEFRAYMEENPKLISEIERVSFATRQLLNYHTNAKSNKYAHPTFSIAGSGIYAGYKKKSTAKADTSRVHIFISKLMTTEQAVDHLISSRMYESARRARCSLKTHPNALCLPIRTLVPLNVLIKKQNDQKGVLSDVRLVVADKCCYLLHKNSTQLLMKFITDYCEATDHTVVYRRETDPLKCIAPDPWLLYCYQKAIEHKDGELMRSFIHVMDTWIRGKGKDRASDRMMKSTHKESFEGYGLLHRILNHIFQRDVHALQKEFEATWSMSSSSFKRSIDHTDSRICTPAEKRKQPITGLRPIPELTFDQRTGHCDSSRSHILVALNAFFNQNAPHSIDSHTLYRLFLYLMDAKNSHILKDHNDVTASLGVNTEEPLIYQKLGEPSVLLPLAKDGKCLLALYGFCADERVPYQLAYQVFKSIHVSLGENELGAAKKDRNVLQHFIPLCRKSSVRWDETICPKNSFAIKRTNSIDDLKMLDALILILRYGTLFEFQENASSKKKGVYVRRYTVVPPNLDRKVIVCDPTEAKWVSIVKPRDNITMVDYLRFNNMIFETNMPDQDHRRLTCLNDRFLSTYTKGLCRYCCGVERSEEKKNSLVWSRCQCYQNPHLNRVHKQCSEYCKKAYLPHYVCPICMKRYSSYSNAKKQEQKLLHVQSCHCKRIDSKNRERPFNKPVEFGAWEAFLREQPPEWYQKMALNIPHWTPHVPYCLKEFSREDSVDGRRYCGRAFELLSVATHDDPDEHVPESEKELSRSMDELHLGMHQSSTFEYVSLAVPPFQTKCSVCTAEITSTLWCFVEDDISNQRLVRGDVNAIRRFDFCSEECCESLNIALVARRGDRFNNLPYFARVDQGSTSTRRKRSSPCLSPGMDDLLPASPAIKRIRSSETFCESPCPYTPTQPDEDSNQMQSP